MEYQFEGLGPSLRIITVLFLLLFVLAIIATAVAIASLPGRIARQRQHPQAAAINICGWFGLPTGLLWVVAMVWAYTKEADSPTSNPSPLPSKRLDELEATLSRIENATQAST